MKDTQKNRNIVVLLIALAALIIVLAREYQTGADFVASVMKGEITPTPKPSRTPTVAPASATVTVVVSDTETATASATVAPPTMEMTPTPEDTAVPGGAVAPFPSAPLCANHSTSEYHALWNSEQGCHYDHEHGDNPFTAQVALFSPGFNLRALLGDVGVGHTNHSSPMENTHKHGGFKWNVQLIHPEGCTGFESAATGVNGSVIQYHSFGDAAIEMEARVHTTASLIRQCRTANPTDYGYVYVPQFQDYGQRIVPYQGTIVPYPNQPVPAYDSPRGPYLTIDCVNGGVPQCRPSLADVLDNHRSAVSIWTSKPTGNGGASVDGSTLFTLLFSLRDSYRLFDWNDQEYPFTFLWLCSSDGGATYNPVGCLYNNSTPQVKEIGGAIPAAWDNLVGFDTDSRVGRITAEGFVTHSGFLAPACTAVGPDCHPIKMAQAFTGRYGSVMVYSVNKGDNIVPVNPSRDIFFCQGVPCPETGEGAVSSGWIGPTN